MRFKSTLIAAGGDAVGIFTRALERAIPYQTTLLGYAGCPALTGIVALGSGKGRAVVTPSVIAA